MSKKQSVLPESLFWVGNLDFTNLLSTSPNCFTKIWITFQLIKFFVKNSLTIFCCEGEIRTRDLKVMSLPSYHCSTSRYILMITIPLPHGHLSTSCAGCTSGRNQFLMLKNLVKKSHDSKVFSNNILVGCIVSQR